MPGELKPLVHGWQHERSNGVDLWRRAFMNRKGNPGEWIAACAGAGIDAATRAFAQVEKSGRIYRVVTTGWAGALRPYVEPGLAYSVRGVIDARTGERFPTTGWRGDSSIWLVTSPVVADEAEKLRLAATYSAALVDMEASAIARLAQMRGIPFYCFKGVSDGYADKLPDFNRFIRKDGRFDLAGMVIYSILRPWHWPCLVRMGENSRKAAQNIAKSLLDFLDERAQIRERNGYPGRKRPKSD